MSAHAPQPAPHANAPPLENGDRLPRCEFERRYEALASQRWR